VETSLSGHFALTFGTGGYAETTVGSLPGNRWWLHLV